MANNRLEFILSAKTEGIEKAFRTLDAGAKKAGKGISDAFTDAGGGVAKLEDALDGPQFSAIAREAKSAALAVTKSFDKAGADVRQAFAKATDNGLPEGFSQARAAVSGFASSAKADLAAVGAAAAKAGNNVGGIQDEVANLTFADAIDQASELGDALAGVAQQAATSFAESADKLREFDGIIKAAFKDTGDQQKITAAAKDLKDAFGVKIDTTDIARSAQILETLGAGTPENLKRVGVVAKTVGRDLEDVAEPYAEFMASVASGNFDVGAMEELRTVVGVSATALRDYGAEVSASGELLTETTAQQVRAQKALSDYINTNERFQGVADRVKSSYSEASTEVEKFNTSVGNQVKEVQELLAKAALPLLKAANEFPESFKLAAAGVAFLTPAAISATIALGKVVALARLTGVTAAGLSEKLKAIKPEGGMGALSDKLGGIKGKLGEAASAAGRFALGTGGSVVAITALAAVLGKLALEIDRANRATISLEESEQNLIKTQSLALATDKQRIKFLGLTAAAIIDLAKAEGDAAKERVTLTNGILTLQGKVEDARRSGDATAQGAAQKELDLLVRRRSAVDDTVAREIAAERKAKAATEDRFRAAKDAFLTFQKVQSQGAFDSKKAELEAIKTMESQFTGEAQKEVAAERKKIQGEILATEVDNLKALAQAQKLSGDAVKNRLRGLLSEYQSVGDGRKAIEKDVNDFAKGLDKEALDRKRALAAQELDLRRSALALQAEAATKVDDEIAALQGKLDAGQSVTKELEAELKGRAQNQKALLEAEAALDRIALKQQAAVDVKADKINADKILEIAAEKERQLDQATANKKAAIDRQLAADRGAIADKQAANAKKKADEQAAAAAKSLDLEAQRADLVLQSYEFQRQAQESVFAERRQQIEQEIALGQDRSAALAKLDEEQAAAAKAAIDEQTKLVVDGIQKRADAAKAGKTSEEQTLIVQQAQLDIEKAKLQAKLDTKAVVDQSLALKKQELVEELKILEALKEQNTERKKATGFDSTFAAGAQSVEDAFGSNASGLGVSRSDREAVAEDGRTQAQVEADIARQRGNISNQESRAKTPDKTAAGAAGQVQGAQGGSNGATSQGQEGPAGLAVGASGPSADPGLTADLTPVISLLSAINQNLTNLSATSNAVAKALNRRNPSTLGMEFERGALGSYRDFSRSSYREGRF